MTTNLARCVAFEDFLGHLDLERLLGLLRQTLEK